MYYPSGKIYSEDLLHESVTKFGDYSFVQHKKLTEFSVPENVVDLGIWAFYNVSASKIVVHENVLNIGSLCFSGSSTLTTVEINTPNITGASILASCTKLINVKLSNLTTTLPNKLFSSCFSLLTVEIPETVVTIGEEAFSGCSKLISITIPENVISIGKNAFTGCVLLGEMNVLPNTAPSLGATPFGTSDSNYTGFNAASKNLYVPSNASGYDSDDWRTVLQDTVGFTINYTL